MTVTKLNEFLDEDDETFIKKKVQKMMYFYPKKLKRNSRKDYLKKITLAFRILKIKPGEKIDLETFPERLNAAFQFLGSNKDKYRKDIFHKMVKFINFVNKEPQGEYPDEEIDMGEKPVTKREQKWLDVKRSIMSAAFKQFQNEYESSDDELELPAESKASAVAENEPESESP